MNVFYLWIASIIAGLVALIIIGSGLFSLSSSLKKVFESIEEMRNLIQTAVDESMRLSSERVKIERERNRMRENLSCPRLILAKSSNLKLFEEKQELSVSYILQLVGKGEVFVRRLQISLINRKMPELTKVIEVFFNRKISSDHPIENEVKVTLKDFSAVSIPFVADFGFLKDACQLIASVEYEDQCGKIKRQEKDILEW